jgi:hypothetical protein
MNFSNTTLSVLVILNLVLLAYVLYRLLGRPAARSRRGPIWAGGERQALAAESHGKAIQRLEAAVKKLAQGQRQLSDIAKDSVRHVGVVRFDAFEDMGGRLSFSAALLDGHGDGVVITSINGRQDTRCYAKRVTNAASVHNLTDEERQAIREALASDHRPQVAEAGS